MRRLHEGILGAALVALVAGQAAAQYRGPRSADYLFVATAGDARALWVNPAGGAGILQATVMGEFALDRTPGNSLAFGQYTLGFNSRGVAFGFRHDRFSDSASGNVFRIGLARGLGRLSVGGAVTVYSGDPDQREGDLGVQLHLAAPLQLGAVIQHIGVPHVRGVRLSPSAAMGLTVQPVSVLQLSLEGRATDREATSGYDMSYRAGLRWGVSLSHGLAVGVLAVADFDQNPALTGASFGLVVGGLNKGIVVGSAARAAGATTFQGASLTGIATRSLQGGPMR